MVLVSNSPKVGLPQLWLISFRWRQKYRRGFDLDSEYSMSWLVTHYVLGQQDLKGQKISEEN